MALKYVSTLDLAKSIGIKNDIPSWDVGDHPSLEEVGLGKSGTSIPYYLDQKNVINDTYTIYYGTSGTAAVEGGSALVEPTHYNLNKDTGKFLLTGAGTILIDTDSATHNLFGEYSYYGLDFTDSYLQEVLERAEKKVDNELHTVFAIGDSSTPTYGQITDEKQSGKGKYDRAYYTQRYPLPDFSTNLIIGAGTAAGSLTVQATYGFATAGIIGLANAKIKYTGKEGSAFTGVTGLSQGGITVGATVLPYIIESSGTGSGTNPAWTILTKGSEYDIDLESGKISIYSEDYGSNYYGSQAPLKGVPNRFRASYLYGWNTVPEDIKRLVIITAKQMLKNDTVAKSYISGRNEFNPDLLNAEADEMKRIMETYISYQISNI